MSKSGCGRISKIVELETSSLLVTHTDIFSLDLKSLPKHMQYVL